MAGGGLKVAFQAGVLQVWLDEAGLTFDHADGASGGVFNLAMYCQGMSGTQIADNWRRIQPLKGMQPNVSSWLRGPFGRSLFRLDKYRRNVFPAWGFDWDEIRHTDRLATFNAYNFSRHELVVRTAEELTEDFLVAAVSLPMWFPPVDIDGHTYIDAVYITDANLEEAIRLGADELWIIWTVSQRARWADGFVSNYFQIIETAANGHFRRVLRRIRTNNERIAAGQHGEFGRRIDVHLLSAEVPLHYLINFSRDRFAAAVELGVRQARIWCQREGIPFTPSETSPSPTPATLSFTEEMKGFLTFGARDPRRGYSSGRRAGTSLMFRLTITARDFNRFVIDPDLEAEATGFIQCDELGGRLPVRMGRFNLFVDRREPEQKRMLYRLFIHDTSGTPVTLSGFKRIRDDPGLDVWKDTTTLYMHLLPGHVSAEEEASVSPVAAGILRIRPIDFMRQLTTFRVTAPTALERATVLRRFARLFIGRLWDVYSTEVLSSAPF